MNMKPGKLTLPVVALGALLMASLHPVAMASPSEHCDQKHMNREQMNPEKMHEHMKKRLDKLAQRLEIKASQQAAWDEFAKSVEMLAERSIKKPNDDADAAAISRYRAEKATEFAKRLTGIADATAKLQKVLTQDQQKILNQVSQRFLHQDRGWSRKDHGVDREGRSHEWRQRGDVEGEKHHAAP